MTHKAHRVVEMEEVEFVAARQCYERLSCTEDAGRGEGMGLQDGHENLRFYQARVKRQTHQKY